jgi:hypothetical protein
MLALAALATRAILDLAELLIFRISRAAADFTLEIASLALSRLRAIFFPPPGIRLAPSFEVDR